jgi:hypothetical protein
VISSVANGDAPMGSLQNLVLERDAFWIVFLKPRFRGVLVRKDLQVIAVANLLAGVDVKPPGIPPEMAIEFMATLKAGGTVRKLTGGGKRLGPAMVSYDRFKKHCELHPEWAAEAWRISKINCNAGKGARPRNLAHCRSGHMFRTKLVT